jgi:hypothetical protein
MKMEIVDPGLKIQYVPDPAGLEACRDLARKVAKGLPA